MPNIIITKYCNLSCPYCFAQSMMDNTYINLDELNNILSFLRKTPDDIKQLGIMGGEPTLHPFFATILNSLLSFQKEIASKNRLLLFTNGLQIDNYIDYIPELNLLVNINSSNTIGFQNYQTLINNLDIMHQVSEGADNDISLGINLYPEIDDFSFIFDLAKKYHKNKIRYSCSCQNYKNYKNMPKKEYYNLSKDIFINFLQMSKNNNIKIQLDGNSIPFCFLSPEEQQLFAEQSFNFKLKCGLPFDIYPDMTASSCFGNPNRINLNNFNDLVEAKNFFIQEKEEKQKQNKNNNKCRKCPYAPNCFGGCLHY